jgi:glucuronoarabinoxylan endo-1,4-beta-xylanase
MRPWPVSLIFGLAAPGVLAPGAAARATQVTVDGAERHQTVEGFGTCLVAWEGRFRDLYRTEAFQKAYAEGVGLTMLRVNLWGPAFEKPTDDWAKIRHEDFDRKVNGGRPQVFLDFGKGLRKVNPDVRLIGTVWSPPAWMKLNRSITDKQSSAIRAGGYGENTNRVDPKDFKHFCKWVVEYVKLHDRQGVPFHAVSPGNEVQFSQTFESCVWDGKDFAEIVVRLREMLDGEGYKHVRTFGPETMTSHLYEGGTGPYVKAVLGSPKARDAVGVFATHGDEDGVKAETSAGPARRFWELVKDAGKPFWITEGGTGGHDWPAPIQKGGVAVGLHNALVGGNCSAFVPWQITERNESVHALMVMGRYTPKTYAAMHYTKFVRPGARRIDAGNGFDTVRVGASLHEGKGGLTVVAINPTGEEQPLGLTFRNLKGLPSLTAYRTSASEELKAAGGLKLDGAKASYRVAPRSIVTLSGGVAR